MKGKLILWAALLLAGFLGGFIPQFQRASRAERELDSVRQKATDCEQRVRLSRFRDLAASIYVQGARRNYGVAGELASELFRELRTFLGEVTDPQLRKRLEEILEMQDPIVSGLAKAEPSILTELENLVQRTQEKARL